MSQTGSVQPVGPHHWLTCSHDDQARKVSAIGASKTRMATNSSPSMWVYMRPGWVGIAFASGVGAGIGRLLCLQLAKVALEPVEARLPEPAVLLHPTGHVVERCRLQAAGAPLGIASLDDQTGV